MKIVDSVKLPDLVSLIDKKWLFSGLWKLKGRSEEGEKIFRGITGRVLEYGFEPKFIYQVYSSKYDAGELRLLSEDGKYVASFELVEPILNKITANCFTNGKEGIPRTSPRPTNDFTKIALLCATVGDKVKDIGKGKFDAGEYASYFYLSGLAAALTEALTEYGHRRVCDDLCSPRDRSFRISPGYPAWPHLLDQRKIGALLPLGKIGVAVGETGQLIPEFSTTSLIFVY